MMTRRELVRHCEEKLAAAGMENTHAEARWLYEKLFGTDYTQDNLLGKTMLPAEETSVAALEQLVHRRTAGEPLQYLLGEWAFYGRRFAVGEGVLIPRQDTETLVDCAKELYRNSNTSNGTVMDLCAGTGCIGITLEKELHFEKIYAVELYDGALRYLRENVRQHGSRAEIRQGDVLSEQFAAGFLAADLIVSNPPYLTQSDMRGLQPEVACEPETALYGDMDGLRFYRGISRVWKSRLKCGGVLLFEVGIHQAQSVLEILRAEGFAETGVKRDLCGVARAVFGRKP